MTSFFNDFHWVINIIASPPEHATLFRGNMSHTLNYFAAVLHLLLFYYFIAASSVLFIFPSLISYITYGKDLQENVLQNLPNGALRTAGEVAFSLFAMFVFVIYLNPVNQALEDVAGIGDGKIVVFIQNGAVCF